MIDQISIGSDPEFVFQNRDTDLVIDPWDILSPRRILACGDRDQKCGACTRRSLYCSKKSGNAEIGTDGSLGELRPKPSWDPITHVKEIGKLIHELQDTPKNLILRGGTIQQRYIIGGHIHIGMEINDKEHCAGYLSHYSGIPLRMIEKKEEIKRRGFPRVSFGQFGGYYIKSYGLEWRMPASWLVSEEIATAALCLTYVVAQNYDEYISHPTMRRPQYLGYLKGDSIKYILNEVRNMEGFGVYKHEIEFLFGMIENKEIWNTNENILETWR